MTPAETPAELRAQRLLRCYPRVWRDRYGDELVALLVDDLADRPHSWRRDIDVVRAGFRARLAGCGLSHGPVRDRSSVTTVATAAAICFVACALSIWTQLADGWLSAPPDTRAVTISLVALSAWLAGLLVVSLVFGARMVVAVVRALRSGDGRLLLRPLLSFASSGAVLVAGLRLIAATSPALHAARHSVLARAAGIGWAATQPISTFWLHPHRLLALPAADIAWMLICPAAVASAGWSLFRLARVIGRYRPRRDWYAGSVVHVLFLPCLAGAAGWVIGSQHAANLNYRAGTLDLLLIAVMAVAAGAVRRAATTLPTLR
jgi:hypothetical protein